MADENTNATTEEEENSQTSIEEETSETNEETSEDSTENEESSDSDDWSEDDLATAKDLYKALQNPSSSRKVIENLAKQVGLEFGSGPDKGKGADKKVEHPETGKTVTIAQLVQEQLPPNMRALAPALTKVLEHVNKEHFEKKSQETTQSLHQERSDNAVESAKKRYEDFDDYEPVMEKLAQKFAPTQLNNQKDYNEYVDMLYGLAKQQAGEDVKLNKRLSKILDKQERNKSRAKPSPSDTHDDIKSVSAKSVSDAIRLAEEQLKKAK